MEGKIALETLQSFKTLLSPTEFDAFMKSEDSAVLRAVEDPEVQAFVKGCGGEGAAAENAEGKKPGEEEEEEEKPEIKKAREDVELARTALAEKEAALNALSTTGAAPAAEIVTSAMFKALQDEIGGKIKGITDLLQKAFTPKAEDGELGELKKSVDAIEAVVMKIAGMPQGTKAVKVNNFFEKSFNDQPEKDDDGKTVLSVSTQKPAVLKVMEDGLKKATTPELVKGYENSIINYNGGDGHIDQAVAIDLYENHATRLTK